MRQPLLNAAFASALAGLAAHASSDASAQTVFSPLDGTDFTIRLESYNPGEQSWVLLDDTQESYFFNRARCECNGDTTNYTGYVRVAIQSAPSTETKVRTNLAAEIVLGAGEARLYVGGSAVNCLAPTTVGISQYCINLIDPSSFDAEIPGGVSAIATRRVWESPPIPVAWLFGSAQIPMCGPGGGESCDSISSCASAAVHRYIYLWADTSGTGVPDTLDLRKQIALVSKVGLVPSNVTASGGNEALEVSWGWPGGASPIAESTIKGIQVFCARGQSCPVFMPGTFAAAFMTSAAACPDLAPASSGELAFANLDPSCICSGLLPPTATSYRIKGLENGVAYGVGVAAVDRYGNLSPITPADVVYAAPAPDVAGSGDGAEFTHGSGCSCAVSAGGDGRETLANLGWLDLSILVLSLARAKRRPSCQPGCSA
jgi:hypothetical protein